MPASRIHDNLYTFFSRSSMFLTISTTQRKTMNWLTPNLIGNVWNYNGSIESPLSVCAVLSTTAEKYQTIRPSDPPASENILIIQINSKTKSAQFSRLAPHYYVSSVSSSAREKFCEKKKLSHVC